MESSTAAAPAATREREPGAGAKSRRREWLVLAVLLAFTAGVYVPVARHGYVHFDDGVFVYANPQVRAGLTWEGFVHGLTHWEHRIWAPLTWLSHMTDVQLFGVEGETAGLPAAGWHHLTSLALHLLNTVLLYLLLRSATGARWRSALVAALFALHPLHVESVAWISERKTLLSTTFGWLCLLAYLRYARRPAAGRYALVLALLALGLMSKPMLVTWPFLMLLLDAWPLGRLSRASAPRLVLEKLPALALVAASCLMTILAQRPAMHLMGVVPFSHRLQNAAVAVLGYVAKTFWPTNLAVLYPYRTDIPASEVAAALLLVACVSALASRLAARRPYLLVGWLWFLGTLVPVLGLVQVGVHSMADRYTYVPQVGLFLALAWGAAELAGRGPAAARAVPAVALAALAACATITARQASHWSDTEALFRHACEVTSDNGWAHRILGSALVAQGRAAEGEREIRIALRQWPGDPAAHNNLGYALVRLGRSDEALAEYREAVRLDPDEAEYRGNLGGLLLKSGDVGGAIAQFRAAVDLRPDLAETHANLGKALAVDGRFDQAAAELREALRLQPGDAALHHALGAALARGGATAEAVAELREALRLQPGSEAISLELAAVLDQAASAADGGGN